MRNGNDKPINRTAALVMSKGVHHEVQIGCGNAEWEIPPIFHPSPLKGLRNGRITVIGQLEENKPSKLLCKCVCGRYVMRTAKGMKRFKENPDVCSKCYGLALMKRNEHHRRTGKWTETNSYL